jgi:hypothetical protein
VKPLYRKTLPQYLSIVFNLERANQLSLLPDKDLADFCHPIEPYQVTKNQISQLEGERNFAIVMNASSIEKATEVDYFITNVVEADKVTASWIVRTYTERNWVEVFYREAKGWLGLR